MGRKIEPLLFSRALFVTRRMPIPALEGALQYSLHLLRLIAGMSGHVDLLCCRSEFEARFATGMSLPENVRPHFGADRKPTIVNKVFTSLPHSALAFDSQENHALLARLLAEPTDIAIIDHIGSSWALQQVEAWLSVNPLGVLWYATHNAEKSTRLTLLGMDGGPWSRPVRSAAILLDAWRIDRTDRRITTLADVLSAITQADVLCYRRDYQPRSVVTAPPVYFGSQPTETLISEATPRRICLLGSFIWSLKKANLRAFLSAGYEIFAGSGIEIVVIGSIEPGFRSELESNWPDVHFAGTVDPEDELLPACRLGVVAEQAGGGFKLKILDYVFRGVPVFALRHAVLETALQDGQAAALFDDMSQLCEGIAAHIDDFDYLNRLQHLARDVCRYHLPEHYDARELRAALENARDEKAGAQSN